MVLFISAISFSQTTIEKSSISSGGNSTTNGTLSIDSTIGEVAVNETTAGNIHISEGFISSKMLTTLGVNTFSSLENVLIYPNPTVDIITVNLKESDTYSISVFNTTGKELNTLKTSKTKQQISLEAYASGIYILVIKNTSKQQYKTFKIIKQ